MTKPTHTSDSDDSPYVALVLFNVAHYRVAIEANQVLSMSDHPSHSRTANAQALLYAAPNDPVSQPTYWLTLRNSPMFLQKHSLQKEGLKKEGLQKQDLQKAGLQQHNLPQNSWQLGVSGEIALQHLPATSIYPLPKLLLSRRFSPALCGITFAGQQLVLVLDARKLTPEFSHSCIFSNPSPPAINS